MEPIPERHMRVIYEARTLDLNWRFTPLQRATYVYYIFIMFHCCLGFLYCTSITTRYSFLKNSLLYIIVGAARRVSARVLRCGELNRSAHHWFASSLLSILFSKCTVLDNWSMFSLYFTLISYICAAYFVLFIMQALRPTRCTLKSRARIS